MPRKLHFTEHCAVKCSFLLELYGHSSSQKNDANASQCGFTNKLYDGARIAMDVD